MDAIILAGGENRRFASHKALAEVDGRKVIESTAALLRRLFRSVVISTNTPELFFSLGYRMVGDVHNVRGPMTGIFSCFVATGAEELFVAACDMPFISEKVVSLILGRYRGQDALVPVHGQEPQPLLGIYAARVSDRMEAMILAGRRSMKGLIETVGTGYIPEEEVRAVDPEGRSFVNINTVAEYERIRGSG